MTRSSFKGFSRHRRGGGAWLPAARRTGRAGAAPGADRRRRGAQRGLDADPRPEPRRPGANGRGNRDGLWHGAAGASWWAAARSGNTRSGSGMKPPASIPGLSAIAERYDHVLLDQWGVLHDGRAIFPAAGAAVAALRRAGKQVLVLS